ncbi:hypothetical protein Pth03_56770 [Planotetraspora thailandica]|uniref:Uncharacterized protein n=1 Tax=Planotetraspora thailandica TaxID=487172 RepID=A0A8J3XZB5_9ACTN|nr:hypothetical protein [Planotetraspora thailandica]GII57288.1 hypothetical protein Pth03_56770 [Planotetraspora thailandica]
MTDHEQPWARQLQDAVGALQEGIAEAGRILAAQGAMFWAYRGDIAQVETTVAGMSPDQLREVSAAAALLGAAADQELGRRAG